MLSNTLIVSEFVEILHSFPTWSCVKMCHTVPRSVPRTWQCVIWYHDKCLSPGNVSYGTTISAFHLALCHMVPRPVYFTWQCVIRYHKQCISPDNVLCCTTTSATQQCVMRTTTSAIHLAMCHAVPRPVQPSNMSYGITTSVFHLAICHVVPQPVYFTWQCVMRYHDQCSSPGNVLCGTTTSAFHLAMCHAVPRPVQPSNIFYGTTTSVFHLAMCHTVPQPVYFSWQCVIRYQNQCISPGNVLCVPRPVQPSNMSYGTTTSVFHLAMCHTVPQPVYFSWQCVIRYHNQCISPGNVSYGTLTNVFHLTL